MSYARQASNYREMEVLSASPARLVVMLYDHLVLQLTTAQVAMEQGNVEKRVTSLAKARAIVSELLDSLNMEAGGEIAQQLASLYIFLLAELMDAGMNKNAAYIGRLKGIAATLRDGFAGAADQVDGRPVAASLPSVKTA